MTSLEAAGSAVALAEEFEAGGRDGPLRPLRCLADTAFIGTPRPLEPDSRRPVNPDSRRSDPGEIAEIPGGRRPLL